MEPLVAVTLKLYVPAFSPVAGFNVRVLVPDVEIEVEEKEAVRSVGRPVKLRDTVPVNPLEDEIVTVSVAFANPVPLFARVMLELLSVMAKAGALATVTIWPTDGAAA